MLNFCPEGAERGDTIPLRVTMLGEEGIEPSEHTLVLSDPPVRSILR